MPDRNDRSPAMSVLPRRLQGAATLAALLCLTTACQAPLASGPSSSTNTVVSTIGTASGTAAAALVALPVKTSHGVDVSKARRPEFSRGDRRSRVLVSSGTELRC